MEESTDKGQDVTEKTPSWSDPYKRLLTESRMWSGSKKFVSKRGEELYERTKMLTERQLWDWRRLVSHIFLWNFLAFFALYFFKQYIVKEYITEEAQEEIINVVGSGPWEVFFSIFGIIYAIIVGMLIVESLSRYNNLRSIIEQELNALEDIRDFLIYLDDNVKARRAILKSLRTYVNSVVDREWEEMRIKPEKSDSDTSKELKNLMKAVRGIRAKEGAGRVALESIIGKVAEVTTYRTNRYMCSVDYITLPMHLLILSLSVAIAVGLITMFIPLWLQILGIFGCTTAMAALYELISDLNRPFGKGDLWTIRDCSFRRFADTLSP